MCVLALMLAGCAMTATPPAPTPSASAPVSASPTPAGPTLVPDGSADDNLPFFTQVMTTVWDEGESVKGRDYVDALENAGFDRADMQVTKDKSSVGIPADSIQFSVLWKDECLVGQVGPSVEEPTAIVLPELPTGDCLIGDTRPIDW